MEGAVIRCIDTFSEENNIITFYISNSITKSRRAVDNLWDPLLSIAGTQCKFIQQNTRVGAEEVPVDNQPS